LQCGDIAELLGVCGAGGHGGIPGVPVSKLHSCALQRTETVLKHCPCLRECEVDAPQLPLHASPCMETVFISLCNKKFLQIPGIRGIFYNPEDNVQWQEFPFQSHVHLS